MTFPASTVPTALVALMAQVQAQVASDSIASQILVCYGEPPSQDLPNDIIQIGTNTRRAVSPELFIGSYAAQSLEEAYEIESKVSTWSGDNSDLDILIRAYQLVSYIEIAVRTDPTLGNTVLRSYPSGSNGGDAAWTEDPAGRLCELTVNVTVTTLN